MHPANERKTATQQFADLFQRAEQSDAFQIDRLKVEISERIYEAMKQQSGVKRGTGTATWEEPRIRNKTPAWDY